MERGLVLLVLVVTRDGNVDRRRFQVSLAAVPGRKGEAGVRLKSGAFTVSEEHLETKQKPLATTNANLSVNGYQSILLFAKAQCGVQVHKLIYM